MLRYPLWWMLMWTFESSEDNVAKEITKGVSDILPYIRVSSLLDSRDDTNINKA